MQQLKPQIFNRRNILRCCCCLRLRLLARTFDANGYARSSNRFQALHVLLQLLFRTCGYTSSDDLSNNRR
jgi:hypothetical protein